MTKICKFIIILCLVILGSCLSTTRNIKNPCKSGDFLRQFDTISQKELDQIEYDLKLQVYANNNEFEGCRAALLGRINLARNSPSEASRYFSIAAKKLPELDDYFILAKAFAEVKNNNYIQAKNLATALFDSHVAPGSTHFRMRIQQVLAEVALKQKDHRQIIKTHEELLLRGYGDKEALLFNLAMSLSFMGEHQKADDVFKQLFIRYPSSDHLETASKLKNLAELQLSLKENEQRFDKLIENLAFNRVISDVDNTLRINSKLDYVDAFHGFAIKALMLNNKFAAGIKRAKTRAESKNATSTDFENYAWGLGKVDRYIDASNYYTRMSNTSSDQATKARACFFAGFSLYEASYYSHAQLAWQSCSNIIENSSYHENYLWYQALSSMLIHDAKNAECRLQELTSVFKKSPDSQKYRYFLGYVNHQLNQKELGNELWQNLARSSKPTYYVLLARQALSYKAPNNTPITLDALSQRASLCTNQTCTKAIKLYNLGFLDEARDIILAMKASPDEKNAMLQSMGLYHDAWRHTSSLEVSLDNIHTVLKTTPSMRALYPAPHAQIVNNMSRKYSISTSVLYAIMNAESGFLHDAKSYRGALGLMQMMPFVAHDLAGKLNFEQFSHERLKEPKVAIELGSLLLATLKRQFDTLYLVVAAYNAGSHHVQKWLDRFGHLPPELFVERIPFKQTREYVKKVLPIESHYFALSGKPLRLLL
jgi:soluble lytic murein transglycosylase